MAEWGQSIDVQTALTIGFALVVVLFLVFDLGVFQRGEQRISLKSAGWQSAFWVAISLVFGGFIYVFMDQEKALTWLLAYVTEKSLSFDNIVVWLIILQYFEIDERYHHKILIYGVIGAIVFRALFIFFGFFLIERFHWLLYVFGGVLVYSGVNVLVSRDSSYDPESSRLYGFLRRHLRFEPGQKAGRFLTRRDGKLRMTTTFLTLLMIEGSDIVFAIDSIPAVFAISQDRFIVYTSNIFAILGLRAMFFLLSGIIDRFRYLSPAVAIVLIFIGVKMLVEILGVHIPTLPALGVVLALLAGSIVLSLVREPSGSTES